MNFDRILYIDQFITLACRVPCATQVPKYLSENNLLMICCKLMLIMYIFAIIIDEQLICMPLMILIQCLCHIFNILNSSIICYFPTISFLCRLWLQLLLCERTFFICIFWMTNKLFAFIAVTSWYTPHLTTPICIRLLAIAGFVRYIGKWRIKIGYTHPTLYFMDTLYFLDCCVACKHAYVSI